jgi:hypothetical protein
MYLKMEVLAFSFELLYRAEVKTFTGIFPFTSTIFSLTSYILQNLCPD